jgi:flagellar biosynthesis GTPase FlhF
LQKKRVIGGELYIFAQRNRSESRSQCLALFEELYSEVEKKIGGDDGYTFENLLKDLSALQEDYYQRAVGPAKWEVYTEKESFIKSQESNYKRLLGFKKESFNALQREAEEKARNDQLRDSLKEAHTQLKKDAELNQKRMESVEQQHREEMQRLHQEQEERMENDRRKYEDFMKAQIQDMAEITKENSAAMNKQYDTMFKSMEELQKANQENLKTMSASVTALSKSIANMRKLYVTRN